MNQLVKGHIIFDHDGTLVETKGGKFVLFPGMRELLSKLKNENYKLYVWTARGRQSTLTSLRDNQVLELFESFSCADDGIPKPHPLGLMKMLEGINKKSIIHIGDSRGDIEGAKQFGIDVVFAAWNEPEIGEAFKNMTSMVAFDLKQLEEYINLKFM